MQVPGVKLSQPDGGIPLRQGLQLENAVGASVEEGCVHGAIIDPALGYFMLNGINVGIFY